MEFEPYRVSNDALDDPFELRRRINDEGYLFLRGFQDRDRLESLRTQILDRVRASSDWLLPGSELADARVDAAKACTEPDAAYQDVYREVYKLREFHHIAHASRVTELLGSLVGGDIMPHPAKILRMWFPGYTRHTTPFHQDFVHFQSNLEVLTVWAPLSDCPIELGPLAVVDGSHKVGRVLDHHFSLGAGGKKVADPDALGTPRCNDFELGDTLIFGCLMVHGALPNVTDDRLRLSLDNRYQRMGLPVSEGQLSPHLGTLEWDQVYADWPEAAPLRYYWERETFERLATDTSFQEREFEEALQLASAGDADAILALGRVAEGDAEAADGLELERIARARQRLAEVAAT
jgi:hypothetical protein